MYLAGNLKVKFPCIASLDVRKSEFLQYLVLTQDQTPCIFETNNVNCFEESCFNLQYGLNKTISG